MIVTKNRVERFTSDGETLRVVGQSGHLLATDTYIKRKFMLELRVSEDEKAEADQFVLPSTSSAQNVGVRRGHLPEVFDGVVGAAGVVHEYKTSTTNLAINKSIDHLKFYPLTSVNSLDVRPRVQAALLPYLCETGAISNLKMGVSSISSGANGAFVQNTDHMAPVAAPNEAAMYRHRLDEQNYFIIQTVNNQTNAQIVASSGCVELGPSVQAVAAGAAAADAAALGTGTCLVYVTGGGPPDQIETTGVPMLTRPLEPAAAAGNAAAQIAAGTEYVALDPARANTTQIRYSAQFHGVGNSTGHHGYQLRLAPDFLNVTRANGAQITGALDGNFRFDLNRVVSNLRPHIDRFNERGYSESKRGLAGGDPDTIDIQLWSRAASGALQDMGTAGVGGGPAGAVELTAAQLHQRLLLANPNLDVITLKIPRRRFLRGRETVDRVNPVLKLIVPKTGAAGQVVQPAVPEFDEEKIDAANPSTTSIKYANWAAINERQGLYTRIAQDPSIVADHLHWVGGVVPEWHNTPSTMGPWVHGQRRLLGLRPTGPLIAQLQAIRASPNGDIPQNTPFMMVVRRSNPRMTRRVAAPQAHDWFSWAGADGAGVALDPPPVYQAPVANPPEEQYIFILFSKSSIGAAPSFHLGRTATYVPFDFQGIADRTVFHSVLGQTADFALNFVSPPAHAEFHDGVRLGAFGNNPAMQRTIAAYFQRTVNAGDVYKRETVADVYFDHPRIDYKL